MTKSPYSIWPGEDFDQFDSLVGHRVRQRRMALGMSCEDLAERAEISQDDLIAIESGRQKAQASKLLKIADALDVSFLTFFGTI